MFVTGLILQFVSIAALLMYIGFKAIDISDIRPGDFMLPVYIIFNIATLFMIVFGAFQK